MKLTDPMMKSILARAIATGGPFDPIITHVALAREVIDNGPETTMADVTEATGGVAVRVPVTAWSAPHRLNDGRWAVDGPVCQFAPDDASEAQSVTAWIYVNALTAGALMGFHDFGDGYGLADEFSSLSIVPRLCIDPQGRFDASVIING